MSKRIGDANEFFRDSARGNTSQMCLNLESFDCLIYETYLTVTAQRNPKGYTAAGSH